MTSYGHDNSRLAQSYDRLSESQFSGGKSLIERMQIGAGARVLDVGCGTGRLAAWLAERVGPQGLVLGIDPLPERVALARAQVPGARFEIGRAEDLTAFAEVGFDGVCMSAVFHWIQDKAKALAEVARVLAPGGRLGVTTTPKDLHAAGTMARLLASLFARPAYRGRIQRERFVLATQSSTVSEMLAMLLTAGLDLVELHVVERELVHASGEDLLDFIEASSFGNFLSAVPPDLHDTSRTDFAASFATQAGPIRVRDYGVLFVARKP
jgi:ubiquinone/menaquinone biosynthesis C-methylase UbiE